MLVKSQAQPLHFWHLTVKEGLPNNYAVAVLQDLQGYMWLGTGDGLCRYDGYQVKVFRHDPANPRSLAGNNITALFEAPQGELWIGTTDGLSRYDPDTEQFTNFAELKGQEVRSILAHESATLIVATTRFVGTLEPQTGKTNSWLTEWGKEMQGLSLRNAIRLRSGQVAVAAQSGWVGVFDPVRRQLRTFRHQPSRANGYALESIYQSNDGRLWLATRNGNGLCSLDLTTATFTYYPDRGPLRLGASTLIGLTELDGELWLGTEGAGLQIMNLATQAYRQHLANRQDPTSLTNNSIYTIYRDRQQRVWLGTHAGGVNIHDPRAEKFAKVALPMASPINTVLVDRQQQLWVGTEAGLVRQKGNRVTVFGPQPGQPGALPTWAVVKVYEDPEGRIWVGNWAGGLSRYNPQTNRFTTLEAGSLAQQRLTSPHVTQILYSQTKGQLLVGTYNGGLNLVAPDLLKVTAAYQHDPANPNSLSDNQVNALYQDRQDRIWVGTPRGLNLLDPATGQFQRFLPQPTHLSDQYINCLFQDRQGSLWVGTNRGLNRLNANGKFTAWTQANGLPSDVVNGILEDAKGLLWISTNNGIAQFNVANQKFRSYTESDGLQSRQFKAGAYFKAPDGGFYFGGVEGLNRFYPDSIRENPHRPEVYFTGLNIFNQPVGLGGPEALLQKVIARTPQITLTHRHSIFSVDFVGLNFTNAHQNQYAYRLLPFQPEWINAGAQRSATYTNLDPGTYQLQVKASNNDGLWNEQGAQLKIVVLPPWWQTWWFRTLAGAALLAGVISFYRVRTQFLKAQNQKLETQVVQRTRELAVAHQEVQAKNNELQASEEELRQNMEELEANQEFIEKQRRELEVAFKSLEISNERITDSIRYAQRIQNAILPPTGLLQAAFAQHFVLFKPKDVV
ncbi:MAG: hypothetical protein MUC97_18535, partial [Bernardetiaceae bacterium]|nr:hypothetical protein [Bernardetiaceae bacterium]